MIFDTSVPMSEKFQESKKAMLQLFKTSLPDDQFMLVTFNGRPCMYTGRTYDYENILDRLLFVESGRATSLFDASYLGLASMRRVNLGRKALLVISEGGENHSQYSWRDIMKAVKESDVGIFGVGILVSSPVRLRTLEEAAGPSLLSEMAPNSGGSMFCVEDPDMLPDITEQISYKLRNQYFIGYKPSNPAHDGPLASHQSQTSSPSRVSTPTSPRADQILCSNPIIELSCVPFQRPKRSKS